jgi:hypothetical protein
VGESTRFQVKVQGFRSRFKVQGSRFKVQGSRFKVQGSRFKVQGSRFKVQGSRLGMGKAARLPAAFFVP